MFKTRQEMLHRYRNVRFRKLLADTFSPASIENLVGWFDAKDFSTLTLSGTDVQAWANKATGPNALSSMAPTTVAPIYGSVGGLPAIAHVDVDSRLVGSFSPVISAGSGFTFFMRAAFLDPIDTNFSVLLYNASQPAYKVLSTGTTVRANARENGNQPAYAYFDGNSIEELVQSPSAYINAADLYQMIQPLYQQGEFHSMGYRFTSFDTIDGIYTAVEGAGDSVNNEPRKAIGEILIYDRFLTDEEIVAVQDYLLARWPNAADVYLINGFPPEFVADFEGGYYRGDMVNTTFADMFNFARGSQATYTDSSGIIQTAGNNEARLGHHVYDGSQWVNKGLLVETELATNRVTVSRASASQNFGLTATTISDVSLANPFNYSTVTELVPTTANSAHDVIVDNSSSVTSGDEVVVSLFVKARGSQRYVALMGENFEFGTQPRFALFDLQQGVEVALTNNNGFIENYANGWYRLGVKLTAGVTFGLARFRLVLSNTETSQRPVYVGDTADGAYYFGAQMESGRVPTSYIPTTGSTVDRAAETLFAPVADTPWNASSFSMQAIGGITYSDENSFNQEFLLSLGVGATKFDVRMDTANTDTGKILANIFDGSALATVLNSPQLSPGLNVDFKFSSRATPSLTQIALNGTSSSVRTPTNYPDVSALNLNLGRALGSLSGPITFSRFVMWGEDIDTAGIEEAAT